MKRWIRALLWVTIGLPYVVFAGQDLTGAQWAPGHLIVNFRSEIGTLYDKDGEGEVISMGMPSLDELLARYRVVAMRRLVSDQILAMLKVVPDFYRLMLLECPKDADIPQMMADFERNPLVEYVEADLLRPQSSRTPNDPLWNSQWDKRLMGMPAVWEFTTGSRDVIVVAIDGGTYWPHDDFFANLWVNPGEDMDHDGVAYLYNDYPGDPDDINGVDDDGNGLVDDLIGWDFIRNQAGCAPGEDCDSQQDNDPYSINDHGTHVLGLMGAVGNNGIGVAGTAWNVRIMASRAGFQNTLGEGLVAQAAAIPCMAVPVLQPPRMPRFRTAGPTGRSSVALRAMNISPRCTIPPDTRTWWPSARWMRVTWSPTSPITVCGWTFSPPVTWYGLRSFRDTRSILERPWRAPTPPVCSPSCGRSFRV